MITSRLVWNTMMSESKFTAWGPEDGDDDDDDDDDGDDHRLLQSFLHNC